MKGLVGYICVSYKSTLCSQYGLLAINILCVRWCQCENESDMVSKLHRTSLLLYETLYANTQSGIRRRDEICR